MFFHRCIGGKLLVDTSAVCILQLLNKFGAPFIIWLLWGIWEAVKIIFFSSVFAFIF